MKYIFRRKINIFLASVFDACGYFLFWPFRKKSNRPILPGTRFLVVRLDHLGDVLRATALPKVLKENFPRSKVTFLTSSMAAPLLDNHPFVDEVLTYDAPWFSRRKSGSKNSRHSLFGIAALLRQKNIQVAFSLRGDLRENLLLWLAGIPERVGYGVTGGGFFLTREARYRKGAHEDERSLDLLRTVGVRCENLPAQIYFSEPIPNSGNKRIGVQLEAGTEAKEWPLEHMKEFAGLCARDLTGFEVVFVGADAKRFEWLSQIAGSYSHLTDLTGKTTLRELLLLMKSFKLFIGPDSGPAHMAASLGIPTLFLFSGTNRFDEWKPLAENARILRQEVPCSPCGLRVCNVPGHPCMSGIEPEQVIRFIKENLR